MYVEDSLKYSICQTKKKGFLQKCDDHCITPVTLQSFKPSKEYSRFLLYCGFCLFYGGIDKSRDRFKHFMESEPRGKVESFFDITRITWLYRHHTIRSFEMPKSQILRDFLHIIILTKFQKICSKFQNCDLRKFHDLPKIHNYCPPENVKFIFINKNFNFPHDWRKLSI